MHTPSTATTRAAERIIAAARRLLSQRPAPILMALDGPSGSGKSTLARVVAEALDATVVPSDDFFAAEISDAEWDMHSPRDRAAAGLDWRRLRCEALEPLFAGMWRSGMRSTSRPEAAQTGHMRGARISRNGTLRRSLPP